MPKTCCAVGCQNHSMMLQPLSFHKFPRHKERFDKWVRALKRDNPDGTPWVPTKNSVICCAHFISGKPSMDPTHPDYVPSVFSFNSKSKDEFQQKLQPHSSALKRKLVNDQSTPLHVSEFKTQKLFSQSRQLFRDNDMENIEPIYEAVALPDMPKVESPQGFVKPLEPFEREMFCQETQSAPRKRISPK